MRTITTFVLALIFVGPAHAFAPDRPAPWLEPDPYEYHLEKAIKDLGGTVIRDESAPGHPISEVCLNGSDPPSDAILVQLTRIRHLYRLQLLDTTTARLKVISELRQVRRLELYGAVTDDGLKELAGMAQLQELCVTGGSVSDAGVLSLASLKRLNWLALQSVALTDAGLKNLAEVKSLRGLYLNDSRATGTGLIHLKDLNALYFYNSPFSRAGFQELGKLTNLKQLTLGGAVTDANLKELAGLTRLEYLCLQQTRLTDGCLKSLVEMEHLHTLHLSDTEVTGVGFKDLAKLKRLRLLNLSATPVDDAGLKGVAQLEGVTQLWLTRTKVTDAGLKELVLMKQMKSLVLAETQISDVGLKHLASFNAMERLYLDHTRVTEAGAAELRKALPKCTITATQAPPRPPAR